MTQLHEALRYAMEDLRTREAGVAQFMLCDVLTLAAPQGIHFYVAEKGRSFDGEVPCAVISSKRPQSQGIWANVPESHPDLSKFENTNRVADVELSVCSFLEEARIQSAFYKQLDEWLYLFKDPRIDLSYSMQQTNLMQTAAKGSNGLPSSRNDYLAVTEIARHMMDPKKSIPVESIILWICFFSSKGHFNEYACEDEDDPRYLLVPFEWNDQGELMPTSPGPERIVGPIRACIEGGTIRKVHDQDYQHTLVPLHVNGFPWIVLDFKHLDGQINESCIHYYLGPIQVIGEHVRSAVERTFLAQVSRKLKEMLKLKSDCIANDALTAFSEIYPYGKLSLTKNKQPFGKFSRHYVELPLLNDSDVIYLTLESGTLWFPSQVSYRPLPHDSADRLSEAIYAEVLRERERERDLYHSVLFTITHHMGTLFKLSGLVRLRGEKDPGLRHLYTTLMSAWGITQAYRMLKHGNSGLQRYVTDDASLSEDDIAMQLTCATANWIRYFMKGNYRLFPWTLRLSDAESISFEASADKAPERPTEPLGDLPGLIIFQASADNAPERPLTSAVTIGLIEIMMNALWLTPSSQKCLMASLEKIGNVQDRQGLIDISNDAGELVVEFTYPCRFRTDMPLSWGMSKTVTPEHSSLAHYESIEDFLFGGFIKTNENVASLDMISDNIIRLKQKWTFHWLKLLESRRKRNAPKTEKP